MILIFYYVVMCLGLMLVMEKTMKIAQTHSSFVCVCDYGWFGNSFTYKHNDPSHVVS